MQTDDYRVIGNMASSMKEEAQQGPNLVDANFNLDKTALPNTLLNFERSELFPKQQQQLLVRRLRLPALRPH